MPRTAKPKPAIKDFDLDFGGDLAKMIADLPDAYLECRDMMHSGVKRGVTEHKKDKYLEQTLACRRCGTTKTRLVSSRTGELIRAEGVRSGYTYAPSYLVKGVGHLNREDRGLVRLGSLYRSVR